MRLLIIALFLVSTLQFGYSQYKLLKSPAQDFEVFYLAGKQLLDHQNPYLLLGKDIVRNPPPTILLFSLLSLLPILSSQLIWFLASVISFIVGSAILFRLLNLISFNLLLGYLTLAELFFPLRYNFGSGQVNALLFLLLILFFYYWSKNKPIRSGVFLALAIILKITPLFFLLPLFLKHQFKILTWMIISLIILTGIPFIFFGQTIYPDYLQISRSFFDFSNFNYVNQSLVGFLARQFTNLAIIKLIYFLLLATALVIFSKLKNQLLIFSSSILMILTFAPFAWQYHFLIALISLVITIHFIYTHKQPRYFYLITFSSYLLMGVNLKHPENFPTILTSHAFYGGALLLLLNFYLDKKLIE